MPLGVPGRTVFGEPNIINSFHMAAAVTRIFSSCGWVGQGRRRVCLAVRPALLTFVRSNERIHAMTDQDYMRHALEQARMAFERGEVPVGAVVVCRDRIVARAHNLTETLHDVTAHAEMQAITAAADALGGKYLDVCTLYVTVEPCVMCAGALGWSQVGRIVYGASDPKRGYSVFAPQALHPKTQVTPGVLADEAAGLMREFFRGKR